MDAKKLVKTLKNTSNESKQLQIIPKLGKYSKGKIVENTLVELTKSSNEEIRAAAIDALLTNPHKQIKKLVMAHMTDTNKVKIKCFEYVGYHRMTNAKDVLLMNIADSDYWVRYFAMLNIGDIDAEDLLEDVEKHLESETNEVVKSACYVALFLLNETEEEKDGNIQKLIQLLNSPDEEARFVTINMLEDMGGYIGKEKVIKILSKRLDIEQDEENISILKKAIFSLKYW